MTHLKTQVASTMPPTIPNIGWLMKCRIMTRMSPNQLTLLETQCCMGISWIIILISLCFVGDCMCGIGGCV